MAYNSSDLLPEARERYDKKLKLCGLSSCPYSWPADTWVNDPTVWPDVEWPEIYSYLIDTPGVFTRETMKNRKSLEAHNQFTSGWVRDVTHFIVPEKSVMLLRTEVMPSQRLNEDCHVPWVAVCLTSTNIITAHCTCMAGLGESCSHVGALLFKLEAAVRLGYNKKICTEEACKWNNDFVKKIRGETISSIQFYEPPKKPVLKESSNIPPSTEEEKNDLLSKLSQLKTKPVVLHCFSDFSNSFIPTFTPPDRTKLPKSLRCVYSSDNISKDVKALSDQFILDNMLSVDTIDFIYSQTRKQSNCQAWFDMRVGRITASKVYDVLHTSMETPSPSLIKGICAEKTSKHKTGIPSLKWGIDNESKAIDDFKLYLVEHHDYVIEPCGLKLLPEFTFIGASADGFFTCRCHKQSFTIEIKCPYSQRDSLTVMDACKNKDFCLDLSLSLKKSHRYYAQVQLQMLIYDVEQSYFVVWTPKWIQYVLVSRDDSFISEMIEKLKTFYVANIVPELLTRKLEQAVVPVPTTSTEKLYCYCNSVYTDTETWIGCDSVTCKWQWFHLDCVNVKRIPKSKWYCPVCRKGLKRKSAN